MKRLLSVAVVLVAGLSPVQAVQYSEAEITKVVDGREVYINDGRATEGSVAKRGSTIRTGQSRARLLFDPSAIGLMGPDTSIRLGERCFRSDQGRVLVNGKILACLGQKGARTKMAGSRGTTYLLETTAEGYELSVLVGEVVVADELTDADLQAGEPFNINDQYPTLNPSIGFRFDGFTYTYPEFGSYGMKGVNAFVPLYQSEAKKIAYSYTSAATNFDDDWAINTEVGYRWLTASNRSSTGLYLGYGGYNSSACFNSLLNLGGQWAKDGWTYGVSSGVKVDGCETGFSFSSLSVGVPISTVSSGGTARLVLSPYMIWGDNIISPVGPASDAADNNVAPGGRLSVVVPATEALNFNTYISYDQVYGTMIGLGVGYRIPFGGGFVRDPNRAFSNSLAMRPQRNWMNPNSADSDPSEQQNEALDQGEVLIRQGQRARFDAEGQLLELVDLSSDEVRRIIVSNLSGQDPLPESRLVAQFANSQGILSADLAAVTGQSFTNDVKTPLSIAVDTPFDVSRPPTANYACQASDAAKDYIIAEALRKGRKDLANRAAKAKTLYLGRPDQGLDGWPVTKDPSKAYRFASSSQCSRYGNRIQDDKRYDGPSQPLVAVELSGSSVKPPRGNALQQQN